MSKLLKFKDKIGNNDLYYNYYGSKNQYIKYRNGSILMHGDCEFWLQMNYDSDNYFIETTFFVNFEDNIDEELIILKKGSLELKLFSKPEDKTALEAYKDKVVSVEKNFFIVIFDNGKAKYLLDTKTIQNKTGLHIGFLIKADELRIFYDKVELKSFLDLETNEDVRSLKLNISLDKNEKFILLRNIWGMFNRIECFEFAEKIASLDESDFIDYKYTDFYSIRECTSVCPSACQIQHSEKQNEIIFKPRESSSTGEKICTFKDTKWDPFLKKYTDYCSGTENIPINVDYPNYTDFGSTIIQSTHYKIEMSLNENPLTTGCVIDEPLTTLIFSTFEVTRPVSRFANYVEYLRLITDFSGDQISLYKKSYGINWLSRSTSPKRYIDTGAVYNIGDSGFSSSLKVGEIEHKLDSYSIICQCFDDEGRMRYPNKQYPKNKDVYIVDGGDTPISGFALLNIAMKSTAFEELTEKPIEFVHALNTISEPEIFQILDDNNKKERFEPVEFKIENEKAITYLLDKFKSRGEILINGNDKFFYFGTKSTEWNVNHNFKMLGIQVQIYDEDFKSMQSSDTILLDKNNLKLIFSKPVSGYVGLKAIRGTLLEKGYNRRDYGKRGTW